MRNNLHIAGGTLRCLMLLSLTASLVYKTEALVIVTNCTNQSPSITQPKRIGSNCLGTVPYSFDALDPIVDPVSGGFFVNMVGVSAASSSPYWAIAWSNTNGTIPWVVALTNALAYPNDLGANRFYALQDLELSGSLVTCYGGYSYSNGLTVPDFEVQLPINNRFLVQPGRFQNGTALLPLDYGTSITILAVNSAGQLIWARNLSSPDFPTLSTPNNSGQRHLALIRHVGQTNFLLSVSATTMVGTNNTSKVALIRLDTNGVVQWAKAIQVPYYSTNQAAGAAGWTTTTNGDSLLWTGAGSTNNVVIRLDPSGALVWARQLPYGGSYYAVPHLVGNNGSILLSFNPYSFSISPPGLVYHNVFVVLDANGNATGLTQVDAPGALNPANINYPDDFTSKSATLYYYGGFSGSNIIGSSSLELTNFNWLSFTAEPSGGVDILRRLNDGRLVFFGLNATTDGMDFVLLNSNLQTQGSCHMFSPANLPVTTPLNLVTPVSVSVSNITVQVTTPTVTLAPSSLIFDQIAMEEEALCTPAGTSLQLALFANQAIISWPTSAPPSTLLFTTNLTTPNWATASPPPVIVGSQYFVTNSTAGPARFFRLRQP